LLVALEFPLPDRASYMKYRHPASGYAVAGVFVAQSGADVRVAITGAGQSVFRWREAEAALHGNCSVAALDGVLMDPAEMLDDVNAPAPYRANLVEVFTRRAVAAMSAATPTTISN
jgi:carbon-monoxide dehydrogenase medium subunit